MLSHQNSRSFSRYGKIISYTIELVVFGFLGWYIYQNRNLLTLLTNIHWQQIVWIVLLDTSSFLINSLINHTMIRRLDPQVSFLDNFALQYINNLLNKVLPTIGAGAAFRAYYLKKKYHFSYTRFASTIAGLYVISFSTSSIIGIVCMLLIYSHTGSFNRLIFITFAMILFLTLIVIILSPNIPQSNHRIVNILKNLIDSWNIIKREPLVILSYMGLTVLLLLISAGYTYTGYKAIGVDSSPVAMMYLSTLGIIIAFLNFTPDGIGIKEGIYAFSTDIVQIPQDLLVLGSLYLRGISIISTSIIAGVCYWILMRNLKEINNNPSTQQEIETNNKNDDIFTS